MLMVASDYPVYPVSERLTRRWPEFGLWDR